MDYSERNTLSAELWLSEMHQLLIFCRRAPSTLEDRAIRKAFHLAQLTPAPFRQLLDVRLAERELEVLLELQDSEYAASLIVGERVQVVRPTTIDTSRYVARLEQGGAFVEADGASPALAMLAVWIRSLIDPAIETPGPSGSKSNFFKAVLIVAVVALVLFAIYLQG